MSVFLEKVVNSTSQSLRGCIKRGVLCVLYMQEAGGGRGGLCQHQNGH